MSLLDPDAIAVVDVNPTSEQFGTVVGQWNSPTFDPG